MKVSELLEELTGIDGNMEVVTNFWTGEITRFIPLDFSCTRNANTTNLFVLIEGHGFIEPIRNVKP